MHFSDWAIKQRYIFKIKSDEERKEGVGFIPVLSPYFRHKSYI